MNGELEALYTADREEHVDQPRVDTPDYTAKNQRLPDTPQPHGSKSKTVWGLLKLFPLIFRMIGKPAEETAQTAIDLASAPEYERVTGKVFYNRKVLRLSRQSQDGILQQRLWQANEAFGGLSDRAQSHGRPEHEQRSVE